MDNGQPIIILDFDGTIIRLFSGGDLINLSENIASMLKQYGLSFDSARDPFDAFMFVYQSDISDKNDVLKKLDLIFTEAETKALDTGIIVNGFMNFIDFVRSNNIQVGIVSNNSEACIKEFFKKTAFCFMPPIVGRISIRPDLMKPNGFLLKKICEKEKWDVKNVVYIGDNPRDFQCAVSVEARFFAMTPTEKKRARFGEAFKYPVFSDFAELIDYLKPNKLS